MTSSSTDFLTTQMCVVGTPLEHHPDLGLHVKREDLCCPGGPNFSKTRGVWQHVRSRPEPTIGVLDTSHSQGGWAVARACSLLGKQCVVFFPVRKGQHSDVFPPQQEAALNLGANLEPLRAGRSAILYHWARKHPAMPAGASYLMPNALKLPETVAETAAEVGRTDLPPGLHTVIVPASSGTIAAGVLAGLMVAGWSGTLVVHMGYHRSVEAIQGYIQKCVGHYFANSVRLMGGGHIKVAYVDEGYDYRDAARPGSDPPWPCNQFYDLKSFRWWLRDGRSQLGEALFWNVG